MVLKCYIMKSQQLQYELSPLSILQPRNQYKLYLKSAITIWSFKMVQINVHDVLEDLTKLRSLIVKKEKLRKLSAFLIITICI